MASLFFYPTPMASKFVFLCGEVFFILVLRKTYLSQLRQCQQHQKQNMLHKFWAQKLMKTKNCHVFNISSIKHWFFFQNLAILKKYSVVHRPPVVLHRLPATGNRCGRHVTHCLPVMMRWHWIHPSLWRAEYRSCWSTLWWFWLTLRSCRWESEKSC